MALDRWIAHVFLALCLAYGYAAFFTRDAGLPPFMQRTPVWPSTFPNVMSVLGALVALAILLGLKKPAAEKGAPEIDHRRLTDYNLGQALALVALMLGYALALRPAGFLGSTVLFLVIAALVLGERRLTVLVPVAAGAIWYLVQEVLGIFLSPLPAFL